MREDFFAAVIGGDESETLRIVEPLHGTGCHATSPIQINTTEITRAAARTVQANQGGLRTRRCTRTDEALRISNTPLETTAKSTIPASMRKRKAQGVDAAPGVAEWLHFALRRFRRLACSARLPVTTHDCADVGALGQRLRVDRH